MVRLKVDCIVTTGIPAIRAAKQVTNTIPIVMNVADDPVQMGLIESLARPGGNMTGFTNIGAELAGKRLELLKEAFPKVSRVGHLWSGLSGKASLRGEILNDLPDRVSDVVIFVGVAHSGLCYPWTGYWTAIFALWTAYVGMFGQAVGVQREFSGVMAKPWRMVALNVGAWLTLLLIWFGGGRIHFGGLSVLDWTLLAIMAGCMQTIWIRLARILRALRDKQPARAGSHPPAGKE